MSGALARVVAAHKIASAAVIMTGDNKRLCMDVLRRELGRPANAFRHIPLWSIWYPGQYKIIDNNFHDFAEHAYCTYVPSPVGYSWIPYSSLVAIHAYGAGNDIYGALMDMMTSVGTSIILPVSVLATLRYKQLRTRHESGGVPREEITEYFRKTPIYSCDLNVFLDCDNVNDIEAAVENCAKKDIKNITFVHVTRSADTVLPAHVHEYLQRGSPAKTIHTDTHRVVARDKEVSVITLSGDSAESCANGQKN